MIDFGLAGLGDPATDLASLINSYGESLVGKMINVYPEMEDLLPRARFYAQAIELQWALLGIESGDYYMIISIDYPSKTKTIVDTQCSDDEFLREVNAWANNKIRQSL